MLRVRALSAGLAARVFLIVLIVIIPSVAIISYDQTVERRRAHDEAVENTKRLAQLAANEQSRIFAGVERLLETLALFPGLNKGDLSSCQALMPHVLKSHPTYVNVFVIENRGLLCAGSELRFRQASQRPGAAQQFGWFDRAMASRRAVIGDYYISLTNGRPAVVIAKALPAADDNVRRVVAAVIGLDELNATFSAVKLPRGATMTLTDRQGTILARTPDAAPWIGRRHAQFPTNRQAGSDPGREMHESVGSDGVRRLYTVLPVDRDIARDLYVTLDIESAAIFAEADSLLSGHLWLLGILTAVAILLALVGGNYLVLQPLRARGQRAEERMRFALEVSRVGVWEHHGGDDRVFWTETLAALHGITLAQFGGNVGGFLACVRADEREGIQRAIGDAIAASQPQLTVEYTSVWPDGSEHRLTTTAHYSYDEQGRLTRGAGVTVDVTEQRSLEDQLRQAQKMDAVGRLAGGVAHDFNNMLTAIMGNAQFLADSLPAGDQKRMDVDEIISAASRAATLTQQLLAFSRKQILKPTVLHLGDVISQMAPLLRRLLGETIDLRMTAGDKSPVKADPGQIAQVVMNLAVNARDAMKHGGRLSIETTDITLSPADAKQFPTVEPGAYVLLRVNDSGQGMDAVTLKRIFEPFFTTKGPGQGTGLGLSTVYGIVEQSGGHIAVTSEPGLGTTFNICLPRSTEAPPIADPHPPRHVPRGTESVLVVEDEQVVREFAARVLTRLGYRVHAVESGAEAIAHATAAGAKVDLILTDVVLPELSGPAMVEELERRGIGPSVVYMSGYTDDHRVRNAAGEGHHLFIAKPFSSESLAHAIRSALDGVGAAA